jgi:hypothetical protein
MSEKEIYILEKLNSAKLSNMIADNRLKKFHVREINPIREIFNSARNIPNAINAEDV